jgi:uncharacterized protein (DUF433 family)
MDWRKYITLDTDRYDGMPYVIGTYILVSTILDEMTIGLSSEHILERHPSVSLEAIDAAILYEADLAREDMDLLPTNYVSYMAGLHREIWDGVDTDEYLASERDHWIG